MRATRVIVLIAACVSCVESTSSFLRYQNYSDLASSDGWVEIGSRGPGGDLKRHIQMSQPGLPEVNREYIIHVPDAYVQLESPGIKHFPALWYFHGQGMNPDLSIKETDYDNVADRYDFFVVYPKGIGKGQDGGMEGTGWNVGSAGDDSVCTREAWSPFGCNCTSCYDSCQTLGFCNGTLPAEENKCGWSTCYDDVAFVEAIIKDIKENFAIDTSKMFLSGCSNGGMMTHYLYSQLPDTFMAAIPNYALPLQGYMDIPKNSTMPFLAIYDRWDGTIPIHGGLSNQGWKYESLETVMEAWGKVHDCDTSEMAPFTTPQDGGPRRFECSAYKGCKSPVENNNELGTVVQCLWDGYHGDWPEDGVIAKVTFWWIAKHVLGE